MGKYRVDVNIPTETTIRYYANVDIIVEAKDAEQAEKFVENWIDDGSLESKMEEQGILEVPDYEDGDVIENVYETSNDNVYYNDAEIGDWGTSEVEED